MVLAGWDTLRYDSSYEQAKEMQRAKEHHEQMAFIAQLMKSAGLTRLELVPYAQLTRGETLRCITKADGTKILEIVPAPQPRESEKESQDES